MIKIWLKHIIYEFVIGIFFDTVRLNFKYPSVNKKKRLQDKIDRMIDNGEHMIEQDGKEYVVNPAIKKAIEELNKLNYKND